MKKIFNIALALTLLLAFSSCEDWLDVNTSPDDPITVTSEVVLPSVLFFATQNVYDAAEYGVYLSQCLTTTGKSPSSSYAYKVGWGGFLEMNRHPQWRRCYIDVGVNGLYMIEDAEKRDMRNYILIARTLMLNSLLTTTDLFGDVPLSETYAFSEKLEDRTKNPRYQSQQEVYDYIDAQFRDLLDKYNDPDWINCPTNGIITVKSDRMFGGDLTMWRALTKALYARFLTRQIPNMDTSAEMCNRIIAAVDDAINDEGWKKMTKRAAIYQFDGGSAEASCMWGPSQPKMNLGWAQARDNQLNGAVPSRFFASILGFYPRNIKFSDSYVLQEKGAEADATYKAVEKIRHNVLMPALDPRARRMMAPSSDGTSLALRSLPNNIGMDVEFGTEYKRDYFPNLYDTTTVQPFLNPYTHDNGYIAFITEEELLFDKAEALYWLGDKQKAYDVTKLAVECSFERYAVDYDAYTTTGKVKLPTATKPVDTIVNVTQQVHDLFWKMRLPAPGVPAPGATQGFSIAHIMQQKYVAMYLQPEQWNDVRRYNYSSSRNGIQYDNTYVYDVINVYTDVNELAISDQYFTNTFSLMRPYNIYQPHWYTSKDLGSQFTYTPNAWINRINPDPETEEKYNRDELIRIGCYKNPDWLRKRQIWQIPTGKSHALTNSGEYPVDQWM